MRTATYEKHKKAVGERLEDVRNVARNITDTTWAIDQAQAFQELDPAEMTSSDARRFERRLAALLKKMRALDTEFDTLYTKGE